MLLPIAVLAAVLGAYPIARGIYVGFTNERVGGIFGAAKTRFIGVQNYRTLFTDETFVDGLQVIVVLSLIIVAVTYVLAYVQALILTQNFPFRRVVRTISMLPLAVAPVVVGQTFRYVYDPSVGSVNGLLVSLGLRNVGTFLPTSEWGILWLAIPAIWLALPFATIFLLASIQGVGTEILEAATVDGAGPVRRFWAIIFPETLGALAAILPLSFAGQIAAFELYFTILGGLTGAASVGLLVPSIFGYYKLTTGLLGPAAATANIILVITLAAFIVSRLIDARERRSR